MAERRPCAQFRRPKDGLYAAYCNRCGYSRIAHDMWDRWAAEAAEKDDPSEL